jgi:hypothetical protein
MQAMGQEARQVSDDGSAASPDPVPYENTADTRWARTAMDLFRNRRLQVAPFDTAEVVSAQVWGTCPRCGHDIDVQPTLTVPVPEGRGLLAALAGWATSSRQGIPDSVEVGCGCARPHPGAPEEVLGCGVSFRLPTTPPPTTPGADAPATPRGTQGGTSGQQGPR